MHVLHYINPMKKLHSEFNLKNLTLRNRIVMPPMCMYSSDESGDAKEEWHLNHYETRSVGGAGLIIVEATAVESRGRISARDLGIWDDSHIKGLSEIVKRVKRHGAAAGIQLAHAGRKCTVNHEDIIAPSPINFDPADTSYSNPREMDEKDIKYVINSFKKGAQRALEAGFDIIEIHGAHGYLINEFLSPVTNRRNDASPYGGAYGGSAENRVRFLLEITREVRKVWPEEKPVSLRISAKDYMEGGNEPEDLAEMINLVKNEGIDIVHVSSGGVDAKAVLHPFHGYQIPAAKIIRRETGLPVIAGGLVTDSSMAQEIIRNGRADLVFLGRELLRNPYFPLQAAKELRSEINYRPVQYERAYL